MSYEIMTDSGSNLTDAELMKYGISMIAYRITINGEPHDCYTPGEDDVALGKAFYDGIRNGSETVTSLINPERFEAFFEPVLAKGRDLVFVSMSSGITGTCQCAMVAAATLREKYPERRIEIVDALAASLGEGLQVCRMAELRNQGVDMDEAIAFVKKYQKTLREIFTVEDLKYLRKGGRIGSATAFIGSVLSLKPILLANKEGKIVLSTTVRGRKRSIAYMAQDCIENIADPENQEIAIAHCDCEEEAQQLADMIREKCPVKNIMMHYYDRCTGGHVGPGAIALFYQSKKTVE